MGISRRDFLETGARTIVAAACLAPCTALLGGCAQSTSGGGANTGPSLTADESDVLTLLFTEHPQLETAGGTLRATVTLASGSARTISVTRKDSDTAVTVNAACTHAACTIDGFASSQYECPCHGSVFDVDGAVVEGPATRALTAYETAIGETGIEVTLS